MRLSPHDGLLEVLADRIGEEPLQMCSNVAVGADDTGYFTSSNSRYPLFRWHSDLLKHTTSGRVLRLTPGGRPALAAPPNPGVAALRSASAVLRRTMATAAHMVRPRPPRVACVLSLTLEGHVRHDLRRRGKGCRMMTSVTETRGELVLGSLMKRHLTVCEPPPQSVGPCLTESG